MAISVEQYFFCASHLIFNIFVPYMVSGLFIAFIMSTNVSIVLSNIVMFVFDPANVSKQL